MIRKNGFVGMLVFLCVGSLGAEEKPLPCRAPILVASVDVETAERGSVRFRVEVRRCEPKASGVLQVVVRDRTAGRQIAVYETDRFVVVQMVLAGQLLALETAGASSNVIQVIEVAGRSSRVAFQEAYKCYAEVSTSRSAVQVRIPCKPELGLLRFGTGRE
jgi:hypothetical protein